MVLGAFGRSTEIDWYRVSGDNECRSRITSTVEAGNAEIYVFIDDKLHSKVNINETVELILEGISDKTVYVKVACEFDTLYALKYIEINNIYNTLNRFFIRKWRKKQSTRNVLIILFIDFAFNDFL